MGYNLLSDFAENKTIADPGHEFGDFGIACVAMYSNLSFDNYPTLFLPMI